MKRYSFDSLAAVALMFVYLMTGSCAIVLGVRVWHTAQARMEENYDSRTPIAYIAGKARQSDAIHLEQMESGVQALVLDSDWEGKRYQTRLYCLDGALYELFSPDDVTLLTTDGARLVGLAALEFAEEDGMLRVIGTTEAGQRTELLLSPRRGEGDGS
ncbi:DUF4860 domain-containing protein [Agathobaculum sp.]|uniref:DUF4860 domain-containing protein n=1 Tax=Agathobaculum sp. TaxID=2048138 RepID=UPI002A7EDEE0|nr:DUF4860 domain-containing protein [Agathobaculum sp.]MDY3617820.1 DUF4860 domain-containing protein [Agathobaculum sp.]